LDKEDLTCLIKELVKIPTVTESDSESLAVDFLYARLKETDYFKENETKLQIIETPREGSKYPLRALVAEVDAKKKTKRTAVLIAHLDVVPVECYGALMQDAFDCDALSSKLNAKEGRLYGRGVMDMKAGAALNALLIEQFAKNRNLFDINLIALFVCDEENSSAGARGVLPWLAKQKSERGVEYVCAIDTEPGEAGSSLEHGPMIYLGTLGKLMPSFYIHGVAEHVNACYKGFSATLAMSKIVSMAECAPQLADACNGFCETSWICLDAKTIRDSYTVTLPDKAYAYFNAFVTTGKADELLAKMKYIAALALKECCEQLSLSCKEIKRIGYAGVEFTTPEARVFTLEQLMSVAKSNTADFDKVIDSFIAALPQGDMRDRGIKIVDKIAELSGIKEPYAVCFFLPPWLPPRTDYTDDEKDTAVVKAAAKLIKIAKEKYDVTLKEVSWFGGLCDLSYVGGKITESEAKSYLNSLPGGNKLYSMPLDAMKQLGMPVINLGPSGENPHTADEYLNLVYSVDVLPQLLEEFIRLL